MVHVVFVPQLEQEALFLFHGRLRRKDATERARCADVTAAIVAQIEHDVGHAGSLKPRKDLDQLGGGALRVVRVTEVAHAVAILVDHGVLEDGILVHLHGRHSHADRFGREGFVLENTLVDYDGGFVVEVGIVLHRDRSAVQLEQEVAPSDARTVGRCAGIDITDDGHELIRLSDVAKAEVETVGGRYAGEALVPSLGIVGEVCPAIVFIDQPFEEGVRILLLLEIDSVPIDRILPQIFTP